MKLVSRASLPVIAGDLQKTVAAYVSVLRDHCKLDAQTRCSVSLITSRPRLLAMIARALPEAAGEFENFSPARRKMTAAEFLAQMPDSTISDDSACTVTLSDFLSRDQMLALLDELAGAVPPSGRGVFLILWVDFAIMSDVSLPVRGRLTLTRAPKGKQRYGFMLFCEFEAKSKSDPTAKKTLEELGVALGVEWKKLAAVPDLGGAGGPTVSEIMVVEQCVQEAFAQAAADMDRAKIPLAGGPHLHSQVAALYKRAGEVTRGVHQKIDFGPEVRQFMRTNFPDYASCSAGAPAPSFRKRLGEHLAGILIFEKTGGFGKCFTLQYQVNFPGTRFRDDARSQPSRSLFLLFHQGGTVPPVWSYAVTEDLARALADCGSVLRAMLPAIEARLLEFLSPVPEALPEAIQIRGRLSARGAYEEARWPAKAWSPDARFIGVHSGGLHVIGHELSLGVDLDGRLQPHGCWVVQFESKRLHSDLLVDVPHTGQIRWNAMVQLAPLLCRPPAPDWLDSPSVLPIGIETIRKLAPDHEWAKWECGILEERSLCAAVWRIHASFAPTPDRRGFRDGYVYLDPVDGSVVHSECHER
jgi:hypothetical protein